MSTHEALEIEQFLSISEQMLVLAEKNQWEQFPGLEKRRKQLMVSVFEERNAHIPADKLSQVIQDVLLINKQIEQRAQQEKITIGQHLYGLKQKQNAHSAYMQNK